MFLFRGEECIIDCTRPIAGGFEFHVSTIKGEAIGWFTDEQIATQRDGDENVLIGFALKGEQIIHVWEKRADIEKRLWFHLWGHYCTIAKVKKEKDLTHVFFVITEKENERVGWISQWMLKLYVPELFYASNRFFHDLAVMRNFSDDDFDQQKIEWIHR